MAGLEVERWISKKTRTNFGGASNMVNELKDGQILCQLANAIEPGSIPKINKARHTAHSLENIKHFLKWARSQGVRKKYLFDPDDLQFGQNPAAVIKMLSKLHSVIKKKESNGTTVESPSTQKAKALRRKNETPEERKARRAKRKERKASTTEPTEPVAVTTPPSRSKGRSKLTAFLESDDHESSEKRKKKKSDDPERQKRREEWKEKKRRHEERKKRREERKVQSFLNEEASDVPLNENASKLQQFLNSGEDSTTTEEKPRRRKREERQRRRKEEEQEVAVVEQEEEEEEEEYYKQVIIEEPKTPTASPPQTPPLEDSYMIEEHQPAAVVSKLNAFLSNSTESEQDTTLSRPRGPLKRRKSRKRIPEPEPSESSSFASFGGRNDDTPKTPLDEAPSTPPPATPPPSQARPQQQPKDPRNAMADFLRQNPPTASSDSSERQRVSSHHHHHEEDEESFDDYQVKKPRDSEPQYSSTESSSASVPNVHEQVAATTTTAPNVFGGIMSAFGGKSSASAAPPNNKKTSNNNSTKGAFGFLNASAAAPSKFMAFVSGNTTANTAAISADHPPLTTDQPPSNNTMSRLKGFLSASNNNTDSSTVKQRSAPSKSKLQAFLTTEERPGTPTRRRTSTPRNKTPRGNTRTATAPSFAPFTPRRRPKRSSDLYRIIRVRGTSRLHRSKQRSSKFSLEDERTTFLTSQIKARKKRNNDRVSREDNNPTLLVPGIECYVPDPTLMWLPATVEEFNSKSKLVVVSLQDSEEEVLEIDLNDPAIQQALGSESLPLAISNSETVEDMRHLTHLNEPSILFNIKERFLQKNPYTYTNDIVIAVNPYRWIKELYREELHEAYLAEDNNLPPHVYATSASAYRHMTSFGENQSILVSGESGAGKTETTKILMNHVASIGGGRKKSNSAAISRVIGVNPLLESFGNATTLRNDNSSRFGKFTQLQFSSDGKLIGAVCETYLLEKSRVTHLESGERTFHIFYQMLSGLSSEDLDALALDQNTTYRYIGGSIEQMSVSSIDDRQKFQNTIDALKIIGLGRNAADEIFQLLAGIIHIGELGFEEIETSSGDLGSQVVNVDSLKVVGFLLGLPEDFIESSVCNRTVKTRGETYVVPLSPHDAESNRDALSKALYAKLFTWLVGKINTAISADDGHTVGQIGVLDIFGFEQFKHNGFEQFCINYANEKLQQKFTSDVFKTVELEYAREGLDWNHITYSDNEGILQIIEGKVGIISILNDHVRQARGTEEALVNKIKSITRSSRDKNASAIMVFPKVKRTRFTIKHYASPVTYETVGFIEKHKDALLPDLLSLMTSSTTPLLQQFFQKSATADTGKEVEFGTARRNASSALSQPTLGTQFKKSLNELMDNIASTNVHYVRCIKPNSKKSHKKFDQRMVVEQLRSAGVIEAIRISRAGYPGRLNPSDIVDRYGQMFPPSMAGGSDRKACVNFLKSIGRKSPAEYQLGKSVMYFKKGVLEELEVMLSEFLNSQAVVIQAAAAGYVQRQYYQGLIRDTIVVQSVVRMLIDRREYLRQRNAALSIQGAMRRASMMATRARKSRKSPSSIVPTTTSLRNAVSGLSSTFARATKKSLEPRRVTELATSSSRARGHSFGSEDEEIEQRHRRASHRNDDQVERTERAFAKKQSASNHTLEMQRSAREMQAKAQRQIESARASIEAVPILQKENLELKEEVEKLRNDLLLLQDECHELREIHRRTGSGEVPRRVASSPGNNEDFQRLGSLPEEDGRSQHSRDTSSRGSSSRNEDNNRYSGSSATSSSGRQYSSYVSGDSSFYTDESSSYTESDYSRGSFDSTPRYSR